MQHRIKTDQFWRSVTSEPTVPPPPKYTDVIIERSLSSSILIVLSMKSFFLNVFDILLPETYLKGFLEGTSDTKRVVLLIRLVGNSGQNGLAYFLFQSQVHQIHHNFSAKLKLSSCFGDINFHPGHNITQWKLWFFNWHPKLLCKSYLAYQWLM